MTSPYLRSDLMRDEGLELTAYPDPVSHGDPWTVGYGHVGPEVHEGLVWTQDQADNALAVDIQFHCQQLDLAFPWWRGLDDLRQDVLANMAFNLGIGGLSGFHMFLAAAQAGNYAQAADDMLESTWAHQVGERAQRLSRQMLSGVHQT